METNSSGDELLEMNSKETNHKDTNHKETNCLETNSSGDE